jgi:hypothetical protein
VQKLLSPLGIAGIVVLAGCNGDKTAGLDDPRANARPSVAYVTWNPGPGDTCPVAVHNKYSTVGPDGKLYPTWHPPVDPETGCTFGHEHGRDPHGSHLYGSVGDIPFGFANEQLDTWDPTGMRHEDHVGHKVEWENDVEMHLDGIADAVLTIKCDILVKLHQGTHSKDAFTNNLHELVYHIKCSDGTELHITTMNPIGRPGGFTRTCDGARIEVGPPTPANSPDGGGQRVIPDRNCVDRFVLVTPGQNSSFSNGLHESWQTHTDIRRDDGHTLVSFNPYFQVNFPSRFYDPSLADITGRPIAVCYETEANGDKARGGPCATSTSNGTIPGITYNDPRSGFNGVSRFVDINSNRVDNADGGEVWYTDPFGKHAKTSPFAGSIRQFISRTNNTAVPFNGPRLGDGRNYGGAGVHPPN